MATTIRKGDRRIQRTRQALIQSFKDIVREKGFTATSIQDITERANVSRGTFYLHFTDKYTMIDEFIREDFQIHIASAIPPTSQWKRETLYLLITTMLDYFEHKYNHQKRLTPTIAPLIERAMHEELTALLLTWLNQDARPYTRVPVETIARIAGWAVFGAAIEWSQEESAIPLDRMANDILSVILDGITRIAPSALPA
ncbi:TetR/AcrR family transcriptional regulator [Ktedonospora formicarum]|uniref:TetR family transcriptional regulator n=1 Tax=Ktedonospora formicarum TaxID=2778364 RepID=A0A8J3I439_9CHLR|nr:TetR/AcrR family transcriptional regulator [Ktedonospora formicarum]GHO46470.1 TetR family transcriptional regulator [Ktedonospora formicarum]